MRRLWVRMTLAFLLVALIAAALVALIMQQTSPQRLNEMLRQQAQSQLESLLLDYHSVNGSFEGVAKALEAGGFFPELLRPAVPGAIPVLLAPANRLPFALADGRGRVVVSMLPQFTVGRMLPPERLADGKALEADGVMIGILFLPAEPLKLTAEEEAYLEQTNQALGWAALGATAAALAMGLILARSISKPLRSLTDAAGRIAAGELQQELPVRSQNEIGQLTEAFNRMSHSVTRANNLRKQMTADIAHELRTPLTVVGGYIESMREGVLAVTPERLDMIHGEIQHLQHLVEDLRTLSRADAGELTLVKQALAPRALLQRMATVYQYSAGKRDLHLVVEAEDELVEIEADEERMVQVLSNLLDNALRYTPAGGTIRLGAAQGDGVLYMWVEDNGKGIPAEELERVFERFHRVERSRHDVDGASGLGLAIARVLVQAHGGTLVAESEPGRGTKMIIRLPLAG